MENSRPTGPRIRQAGQSQRRKLLSGNQSRERCAGATKGPIPRQRHAAQTPACARRKSLRRGDETHRMTVLYGHVLELPRLSLASRAIAGLNSVLASRINSTGRLPAPQGNMPRRRNNRISARVPAVLFLTVPRLVHARVWTAPTTTTDCRRLPSLAQLRVLQLFTKAQPLGKPLTAGMSIIDIILDHEFGSSDRETAESGQWQC